MRPLLLGADELVLLDNLRELAATAPIDVAEVVANLANPDFMERYGQRMTTQSVILPLDYLVTFSIETGHPSGTMRHLSVSGSCADDFSDKVAPAKLIVMMIAERLGFVDPPHGCIFRLEPTNEAGRSQALNIIQPIAMVKATTTPQ